MMINRKYDFVLRAASSVEIYDYASGAEVVRLDDAHVKDFLQWYFDGPVPGTSMQIIPEAKALVEAAQALLDTARGEYEDIDLHVSQWFTDEPTVKALDAALAPFKADTE